MRKLKSGFTLPEVLIAIGLVGVISAFMMNVMTHKRPNQNKAMFRKAYYIIEREASAMAMDDDNFPSEIEGSKRLAYFDPTLDKDDENPTVRNRRNTGKYFCQTFANALNTVGEVRCNSDEPRTFDDEPSFETNDGITWFITPNIICDPTDQDAIAEYGECSTAGLNSNNVDDADPECPASADEARPYICVSFDVNGPCRSFNESGKCTDKESGPNENVSASQDPNSDVEYADRGYIYVFWNGKVKAPTGQTSRYLKSVTVL